jgi:excisionase family DNA binding protein
VTEQQHVGLIEPFLTVAEMAKALKLSEATIIRRIEKGAFPGAYKEGRPWRIPRSAWTAYLESIGALPSEDAAPKS